MNIRRLVVLAATAACTLRPAAALAQEKPVSLGEAAEALTVGTVKGVFQGLKNGLSPLFGAFAGSDEERQSPSQIANDPARTAYATPIPEEQMKKIMETYDDTNPSVNLGFRVYEGLSGPGGSPQRTIIVARNLSTHHLAYLVEIKDGRIGIQTTSSEGYPIEIWCSYTPNEPKPHNPLGPILSAKAGNNINLPPNAPEVYPALVQMLLAANKKADPTIAVKIDNLGNGTGIVLLQGKGRTTRVDLVGKKIGLKTVFKNYKTPSMDIHTGLNNVEWGDQLLFTETANNIARKIAPMFSHLSVGNIGTLAASLTRTMYLDSLKATQLYASFLGNKRLFEELPTFDVLPNDLPSLETYLGTPPSAPSQATKSGSTQKKSMTKKANLNKKSPKPSSTKTVIPTKKVPATEKQLLQDKKTREVRADQRCPGLLPRCNI